MNNPENLPVRQGFSEFRERYLEISHSVGSEVYVYVRIHISSEYFNSC